jgi:hypothetical protein
MSCIQTGATITANLDLVDCDTEQPLDISTQTSMEVVVLGPGNLRSTHTPSFVTDGTDGKLTVVLPDTVFTVSGEWKIQAVVTLTGGIVHPSEVKTFRVRDNI